MTDKAGKGFAGAYIPQCNEDGTFNITQCHGSAGYCWCVDREGRKVIGSRYRLEMPECKRCRLNYLESSFTFSHRVCISHLSSG